MRRPATHGATTGAVGNLGASASEKARDVMAALAREQPEKVVAEITKMREMTLPAHHDLKGAEVDPKRLHRILRKTYERQPEDFATLLGLEGVGARTLRALSLVGELVVWRTGQHHRSSTLLICARRQDKDGYAYPVDKKTYDTSIKTLHTAVEKVKLGQRKQVEALRRLMLWTDKDT